MLQPDRSKEYVEKIVTELKGFTDYAVVGLSGGIDSTCVATLCALSLGKSNVFVVHMPHNEVDTKDPLKFNGNSFRIANKLGVQEFIVNVKDISESINNSVAKALQVKFGDTHGKAIRPVNNGNARSRARMCVLYSIAHHLGDLWGKRVRVIGTGNLSEDFIGYDTKGGDALADIFPIGELYKSEVYQLAEHFVSLGLIDEDMIDRNPSAGLWDGQSDEAELGHTYNDMQPAVEFCRANYELMDKAQLNMTPMLDFVWKRHLANRHKHEAPPVVKLK
jgi:NAD+ synthase